jgi:hypothetical protein
MNLSERLGAAAQLRASRPPALEVLELVNRHAEVDVTGAVTAVDLRHAAGTTNGAPVPTSWTPDTTNAEAAPSRFGLRLLRLDRRDPKPADTMPADTMPADTMPAQRGAVDAPLCPRCGAPSRVDINDRTRGVLHVSCDECFAMWQTPATPH